LVHTLVFSSSTTQLIEIIKAWRQMYDFRAKTKTCTPWGPQDRVWETLVYVVQPKTELDYMLATAPNTMKSILTSKLVSSY
jgi:hypothetical protein